ncbi:MAG: pilus assembly protein PilM [Gammaproteobacteria bacterium]
MIAISPFPHLFSSKSLFNKVGAIGLDFAIEKINLVQLGELTNGELALKSVSTHLYENSREAMLDSPKLLRRSIREAFKKSNFSGKKVISSIPPDEVRVISVDYQHSSNDVNNHSLIQAIKQRIDDDLDSYVIDYMSVRANENDSDQLAIVALVKNDVVTKYLEAMRYAGLTIDALEIRPAAINRYVYSILEDKSYQNILSINFGDNKSYLTITSGRRLLFDQQVDFGVTQLLDEISNALDISNDSANQMVEKYGVGEAEAETHIKLVYDEDYAKTLLGICKPRLEKLLEEVNRALLFSASENQGQLISKIYLFGSMTHWKGLTGYLKEKLNLDVETIKQPLDKITNPHGSDVGNKDIYTPELSIAIGHALRGLV